MSSTSNIASSSSNFDSLFNVALENYSKQTGKDLRNHPLADRIDNCDSADSILDILQEQSLAFDESRKGDTKLFNWIRHGVNVLHALSVNEVLSESSLVSLVLHHSFRVPELSVPRCFRPQRRFSPLSGSFYPCVSSSLSPPHSLSHSGLPDCQAYEGKLRCPGRYV